MTRQLTFGSLFAGVGGFDIGMERAGYECLFQVEWDKQCQSVLTRDWPAVRKWGDISKVNGATLPPVDVIVWGSPCQDLSMAGKRAGIAGGRSGLFFEGIRVIREMREASHGQYPRVSVWENVVGALNSNDGADFGVILDEMAEVGAMVVEWAVLDAQFFGIPQRRARVFCVAVLDTSTAERCPNPLLPIAESLPRDLTKGKPSGEDPPPEIAGCLRSGGDGGVPSSRGEHLVVGPLTTGMDSPRGTETSDSGHIVVEPYTPISHGQYGEGVGTLRASGGDLGGGSETLLIDSGQGNEPRASVVIPIHDQATRYKGRRGDKQDGKGNGLGIGQDGDPMNSLTTADRHAVAIIEETLPLAFSMKGDGGDVGEDVSPALRAGGHDESHMNGGIPPAIAFSHTQGLDAQPSEIAFPTLRGEGGGHAVAYDGYNQKLDESGIHRSLRVGRDSSDFIAQPADQSPLVFEPGAMSRNLSGSRSSEDVVHTLRADMGDNHPAVLTESAGFKPGASSGARSIGYEVGLSPTLEGGGGGNNRPAMVDSTMCVRRLTPLECERLMGWPDNHTKYNADGSLQADSHRYKQCGNGVASPVAEWVGSHVARALRAADSGESE